MNIVVGVDSFKGSLSSLEAGNAIKKGIQKCINANVAVYPLSDGGEGFVESYVYKKHGIIRTISVKDAMLHDIQCSYQILQETRTAVMEMASMCGISCINKNQNDVLHATTYGLGQMIMDAMDMGCRDFIIGLGGSGTNDGGSGALMALGYEFSDAAGNTIPFGSMGLSKLQAVSDQNADKRLPFCRFRIACDVKNPLIGNTGCSVVFGPQKGADKKTTIYMDSLLKKYAEKIKEYYPNSNPMMEGSGAAGGLGFSFVSFLNAKLVSGIETVLENNDLEKAIKNSDIIITGEGCLDEQTIMGKAPAGIAKLAKKYNKPVVAFAGTLTDTAEVCNSHGIDAFFCILKSPCTKEAAMDNRYAYHNLMATAEQVFRLYHISAQKN